VSGLRAAGISITTDRHEFICRSYEKGFDWFTTRRILTDGTPTLLRAQENRK